MKREKDPRKVAAGRKGGQATARRLATDPDFYRRIGELGGEKGGNTTLQRYGRGHYVRIARLRRTSESPIPVEAASAVAGAERHDTDNIHPQG